MIVTQIKKEYERLLLQLQSLDQKLTSFPDGDLLCTKNGRYTKWFLSNGSNPVHLSKKDRPLAAALALKKYYLLQKKELSLEANILRRCLKQYEKLPIKSNALLDDGSCYNELLSFYAQSHSDTTQQWGKADYEHNPNHPETLIHTCLSGHKVRSKSEVIIANALFTSNIPYRYECAVHFENMVFFPDFTIRHPETSELFYWEHFGMMDIASYSDHAFNKLKIYASHNIIPTINLITTYEVQSYPLDSTKVSQIIQDYFM